MRIYEGSPRQDFEEVFRSIGAFLDQRGMQEVLLAEAPDGFIVQGLVLVGRGAAPGPTWARSVKETLTFLDDDIARFMEEAVARRGARARRTRRPSPATTSGVPRPRPLHGRAEAARRVLLRAGRRVRRPPAHGRRRPATRHVLAEFTREDIETWSPRDRPSATCPTPATARQPAKPDRTRQEEPMKALKTVAVALGITLAALIVIPLIVLAGLFVWLKVTEEADEEALELDQEGI